MAAQKILREMNSEGILGPRSIFRNRSVTFVLISIISKQAADKALEVDLTVWNTSHWEGGWNSFFLRLPSYQINPDYLRFWRLSVTDDFNCIWSLNFKQVKSNHFIFLECILMRQIWYLSMASWWLMPLVLYCSSAPPVHGLTKHVTIPVWSSHQSVVWDSGPI